MTNPFRRTVSATALALLVLAASHMDALAQTGVRGEPAAVAAAEQLLLQVGGRAMWQRRTLVVEERGYLPSGETAELRIWRDFAANARLIERRTPTQTFREWVAPGEGWASRNGELRQMAAGEHAAELQGILQEPYHVYHRIARNDPALRVELRDAGASLYVFDTEERLLCWFRLARDGALRGWGNFFDGAINEHYYGPLIDMGDANLPRWGAAADGGFRFEYSGAHLLNSPLVEPAHDAPFR